jgi:uncharacterized membrane protein YgcG
MANLKAAAVNLTTAISKKKSTTRCYQMLERCYQEFKKLMDSLAEDGTISLEDKAARDLESWTVYEDALEANEQYLRQEKLCVLNADCKAAEEQLMARVKKINSKLDDIGVDSEEVEAHVSTLEANLKDMNVSVNKIKRKATVDCKVRKEAMAAMAAAEEEVRTVISKLKKKQMLHSTGIQEAYSPAVPQDGGSGGITAAELGKAISRASQEEKALNLIPEYEGSYRAYPKFKKEFRTHVGARGDLTKEQKASYLLHKLKGAAKKEVENIEDLDDIWDALERRFNRPALYAQEAMKSLVGWRPIPFNDLSGLAKYYSLVLTTRRELSQYGQERELETYGMLHEMVSKLPLMEKNEYIKSRREDSPSEFFAFVKKRQVEVAELDCEQMAGSNQKYFNKGAASGASGGNGGSTGGSTSGGGSGSSYNQFKKSNNDGKSHNNTRQGTANVAAGKQNANYQTNQKQKTFVCAMGCGS